MTARQSSVRSAAGALIPITVLVALWQVVEVLVNARFPVVPAPTAIMQALFAHWTVIALNMQTTLAESVAGFVIGTGLGALIAFMFVTWPSFEEAAFNVVVTVHSIPLIAIAPLLIIWFGTGSEPEVIIAALACFFPTAVNMTRGFRAADPGMHDLMRVLGASRFTSFRRVVLPASLPYAFAALKIAAPGAILGATVGEWLGTGGLGYLLFSSMVNFDVALLWATMLITTLCALAGYLVFSVADHFATPWHRSSRETSP